MSPEPMDRFLKYLRRLQSEKKNPKFGSQKISSFVIKNP